MEQNNATNSKENKPKANKTNEKKDKKDTDKSIKSGKATIKTIKKDKFLSLKTMTLSSDTSPILGVTFQKTSQKWIFKNNQYDKSAS
jgi:hypothetical protein